MATGIRAVPCIDVKAVLDLHDSESVSNSLGMFIADLQRSLRDAFEPALLANDAPEVVQGIKHNSASLHPLALNTGLKPTSLGVSSLQLPWELLSSALSRFEYQVLNTGLSNSQDPSNPLSAVPPSSNISEKDRIRLLALLRENGALTLADLTVAEGTHQSKRILDRRKHYRQAFPGTFAAKRTVKDVLESIARDAGWETYQGAEEDEPGGDNGMQTDEGGQNGAGQMKTMTITMAGKGIVLDVDFEQPRPPSNLEDGQQLNSTTFGLVTAVRFSYGVEGSTDAGIDKLLSRQAKETDWPALRNSLIVLSRLDDVIALQESLSQDGNPAEAADSSQAAQAASEVDLDPYGAMKALTIAVQAVFNSELEVASSPAHLLTIGHGLVTEHYDTPYLNVLYHAPAFLFHTEEWEKTVQSGCQNEELSILAKLEEVRTMSFSVAKSGSSWLDQETHNGEMQPDAAASNKAAFHLLSMAPEGLTARPATGLQYVSLLDRPMIISASAGRRLQDILLGSNIAATYPMMQQNMFQIPSTGYPYIPQATFESLVLPFTLANTRYTLDSDDIVEVPPVQATLQPMSMAPAFSLDRFNFHTADQLLAVIEVLRVQCLFTDLLNSAFAGATLVEDAGTAESRLTLADILSDRPLQQLDVVTQTDVDASWPPSLSLSFLLPHFPSWLPVSASIRITPSQDKQSGYDVDCAISCAYAPGKGDTCDQGSILAARIQDLLMIRRTGSNSGKEAMENLLFLSRDVRLLIRWISKRLLTVDSRPGLESKRSAEPSLELVSSSLWDDIVEMPNAVAQRVLK